MKKRTIFVLLTVFVLFVCASPLMQKKVQAEGDQYQYAKVGTPVTFTANAGFSVKSYQWQYSNDGGATWKNFTAADNKTSVLKVVVKAGYNGLRYRCVVRDANGVVLTSDPARLTVK